MINWGQVPFHTTNQSTTNLASSPTYKEQRSVISIMSTLHLWETIWVKKKSFLFYYNVFVFYYKVLSRNKTKIVWICGTKGFCPKFHNSWLHLSLQSSAVVIMFPPPASLLGWCFWIDTHHSSILIILLRVYAKRLYFGLIWPNDLFFHILPLTV